MSQGKGPPLEDMSEATVFAVSGESATRPLPKPGDVIGGQFEIVRLLGRGGMGVVYEAHDRLTGERLALKTILPAHVSNPKAVARFLEEVNAARRLRHPNIVAVFDVGREGSLLFFTMEFLVGQSLRERMKEQGPLSVQETVGILRQLCTALEYAHQYMVHRDLSPENVMLLNNGEVKLLDFGLARMADRATMTAAGASLGKAHYMSPEQRRDSSRVDARTDLFALGVMLFEMLTGQLPGAYQRACELREGLPTACDDLIGRCLISVDKRIGSAREFRSRLEGLLSPPQAKAVIAEEAPAPAPALPAAPAVPITTAPEQVAPSSQELESAIPEDVLRAYQKQRQRRQTRFFIAGVSGLVAAAALALLMTTDDYGRTLPILFAASMSVCCFSILVRYPNMIVAGIVYLVPLGILYVLLHFLWGFMSTTRYYYGYFTGEELTTLAGGMILAAVVWGFATRKIMDVIQTMQT